MNDIFTLEANSQDISLWICKYAKILNYPKPAQSHPHRLPSMLANQWSVSGIPSLTPSSFKKEQVLPNQHGCFNKETQFTVYQTHQLTSQTGSHNAEHHTKSQHHLHVYSYTPASNSSLCLRVVPPEQEALRVEAHLGFLQSPCQSSGAVSGYS